MLNPPDSAPQSQNTDGEGVEFSLPDEIVVEILNRVPAIDVLRFRSVCKKWRELTCSQNFVEILSRVPAIDVVRFRSVCKRWRELTFCQNFILFHLRRCVPMLLFEEYITEGEEFFGSDHYLLDQFWKPLQTAPKRYQIGNLSEFDLRISMNGLVVMRHPGSGIYRIVNPVYPEKVEITFSGTLRVDDLCGVFFHPSLKEYCTLWRITVSGESNAELVEYRILNLGSQPCWRVISNPWSHRARSIWIPPILIDEYLYWVVEPEADSGGIMEFDIRNGNFTFIPSPAPGACSCIRYNINILDIGGHLSLVSTTPIEHSPNEVPFDVNIWTLKDRARHLWTASSYRINTDDYFWYSRPMALVNDELVFHNSGGFFSWNLKLCILKKFEDNHGLGHANFVTTHVMSLVSLRNCKSEIYVDEKGEVEKNRKRSYHSAV